MITRGGCSEVGNGVDGVLLIDSIVSLIVRGASSGAASITEFAMHFSKIGLELILRDGSGSNQRNMSEI